ncbi:MAG: hypothetical protein ACREJM_11170, partial [Candidatus Saccharimonadales bacterium]
FKIRGSFTITAPNGNSDPALTDRWVTYETNRNITWTTQGTIPNVKLQYSNDGFVSDIHDIDPSAPNGGTYHWVIPDAVLKDVNGKYTGPNMIKVRVSDVNDSGVYDDSDYAFKLDYYMITWEVRDLLTNLVLSDLSVNEVNGSDPTQVEWAEAGITTSPNRIQPTPAGTWVATWSKTGYGDLAQTVIANQDQSYLLLMETTAVHIWTAASQVSYDPGTDIGTVSAWLERDGSVVVGAVSIDYEIYDGSTLITTLSSNNPPNAAGFYNLTIPSGTLVSGKTYTTLTKIANAAGGLFKTPNSFEVTTPIKLQQVQDKVNQMLDTPLSQVNANLQATLNAQT